MHLALEKTNPHFTDLVNNYQIFHDVYDTHEKLLGLPNWKDHSSNGYYDNYEHIDELLSKDLTDEDLERSYTVRIPISYIFSSEESLGGFDRPLWTSTKGDKQCRENLNTPNGDGTPKGYRPEDAQVLAAYLRPCGNNKYQVVKFLGNNRTWMKLLSNRGKDSEVLVNIKFHKESKLVDYIQKESESHSTDAGDRSGQNEQQKFVSSYRAGRPFAKFCFDFLKEHELEYKDIMEIEGVRNKNEEWLRLSSLQGIKEGKSNGYFKTYGELNTIEAIKLVKRIAKLTKEKIVGSTPIACFAQMFSIFTVYGKLPNSQKPIYSKKEFADFVYDLFVEKNKNFAGSKFGAQDNFNLSNLTVSGGVKDVTYINAMTFWPYIIGYWKNLRGSSTGFSFESYAVEKFVDQTKDRYLKNSIKLKVSG